MVFNFILSFMYHPKKAYKKLNVKYKKKILKTQFISNIYKLYFFNIERKANMVYDSMALRYITYFVHNRSCYIARATNKCDVFLDEQINNSIWSGKSDNKIFLTKQNPHPILLLPFISFTFNNRY